MDASFHTTNIDTERGLSHKTVPQKRSSDICWAPDGESSNFSHDNRFPRKNVKTITVFTTHYPLVDPPPPLLATGCTPTRLALIHWKMAYATNWFPFSTVVGKAADYETIFSYISYPLPLVAGLAVLRLPPLQQLNLKSTKKHRNTTIHHDV